MVNSGKTDDSLEASSSIVSLQPVLKNRKEKCYLSFNAFEL